MIDVVVPAIIDVACGHASTVDRDILPIDSGCQIVVKIANGAPLRGLKAATKGWWVKVKEKKKIVKHRYVQVDRPGVILLQYRGVH